MAYYKTFDRDRALQSPVFLFWFRRYAPFEKFGGATGFDFEGDKRSGPSTSPGATSRTYGCLFVNRNEVLYGFSGTSGTRFLGYSNWTGGLLAIRIMMDYINHDVKGIIGHSDVSLKITEANASGYVSFKASTAGANPLIPGSPDIDTIVKASFNFKHPRVLVVEGEAFGDDFPNLEIFLSSASGHTAILLDFRTTGGQETGPVTRLPGLHADQSLGKFSATLPLNDKGQLAADFKPAAK
ncbi:MAG: hypothetical protein AB7H90_12795 [Alphaproteobacteria bacterium]